MFFENWTFHFFFWRSEMLAVPRNCSAWMLNESEKSSDSILTCAEQCCGTKSSCACSKNQIKLKLIKCLKSWFKLQKNKSWRYFGKHHITKDRVVSINLSPSTTLTLMVIQYAMHRSKHFRFSIQTIRTMHAKNEMRTRVWNMPLTFQTLARVFVHFWLVERL